MPDAVTRREMLQGVLSAGGALAGLATWALPVLAEGEEVIPLTDFPKDFNPTPRPGVRHFDTRTLQNFLPPSDQFFTVQHYGQPTVDASTYRLRITGLIDRPLELPLPDLKKRRRLEQVVGFECSGNNNPRGNPLVGNARWAGTPLAALLKDCGVKSQAREVVFFGADKGTEEVSHGGSTQKVEQRFARSLSIEDAVRPEVLVAYEMNGQPLSLAQGCPVRLIVPGWYGVANVKWLEQIHLMDRRFMGKFMAREYVTLRGDKIGSGVAWNETSVSRMQLKSMVARVTRSGSTLKVLGFALNDGTPLKSVEVSIDNGPWKPAALDKSNTPYSWKLFTYRWEGTQPGEHTLVSRAIDANGRVQPTEGELESKKTRWENNGQYVRKVLIS
ncbi:MAG: molybdopterin-dependent oxidoreductase [Acidobacteria bacterium]|nr:molybdopterin-dependent oxidoreductase [Acidobacteriota bacterium]MCI0723738.1 molybdopterin-dependent oxidoreductase [Acidobacteriota bacterium]